MELCIDYIRPICIPLLLTSHNCLSRRFLPRQNKRIIFIFGKLTNANLIEGNRRPQKMELEKDQFENLSSVTANIGLRFNL